MSVIVLLLGIVPSISMILSSLLVRKVESFGELVEACLQNFCAGLILAALGGDLFPLLSNLKQPFYSAMGILTGFCGGFIFFWAADKIVQSCKYERTALDTIIATCTQSRQQGSDEKSQIHQLNSSGYDSICTNHPSGEKLWVDDSAMSLAQKAICVPKHRLRITAEIDHMVQSIMHMRHRSEQLSFLPSPAIDTQYQSVPLSEVTELSNSVMDSPDLLDDCRLGEELDAAIHRLQYNIDHCRRLIQGVEASPAGRGDATSPVLLTTQDSWSHDMTDAISTTSMAITTKSSNEANHETSKDMARPVKRRRQQSDEERAAMHASLCGLLMMAEHVQEHMREEHIDAALLQEIHAHLDDMDQELQSCHHKVENAFFRWSRFPTLPQPRSGDTVPPSLMLPVVVDCCVDGFLLGIAGRLSIRTGCLLCVVTTIEMGFLGAAVSMRLRKCTGSSPFVRLCSLLMPPLLIPACTTAAAMLGATAGGHPLATATFISFGIFALVNLVTTDLLPTSQKALHQGTQAGTAGVGGEGAEGAHDGVWIASLSLFLGMFLVMFVDQVMK